MSEEVSSVMMPRRILLDASLGGALSTLSSQYSLRRMLIATETSYRVAVDGVAEVLRRSGVRVTVYEAPGDCRGAGGSIADVEAIAHLAGLEGADAIVTVGSSCLLCAAKAALVRIHRPTLQLERVHPLAPLGVEGLRPLLIAAPAGGSRGREADWVAAVDVGGEILALVNPELTPHAIVLDPSLLAVMPRAPEAIDIIVDSVAHAFETLASKRSNPLSEAISARVLREVFRRAELLRGRGGLEASWPRLAQLSALTSIANPVAAISLTCGIALAIQEHFNTPHGVTAAVALQHTLRLYEERSPEARSRLDDLVAVMERVDGAPELGRASLHVSRLLRTLGLPRSYREMGIPEGEFREAAPALAERALELSTPSGSPVDLTPEELASLLERAYEAPPA
ncbi:MAG: iron-containing alcohol dehydrogenase [Desulfurococcales archaeon]|nr:iron-containing alcohol dehydrogenase [Desulfurococcales archaeon]